MDEMSAEEHESQKRVEQDALALVKAQLEDEPKVWLEILEPYTNPTGDGDIFGLIGALADHLARDAAIMQSLEEVLEELHPRATSPERENIDRMIAEKLFA